jgi:hypothetical protein
LTTVDEHLLITQRNVKLKVDGKIQRKEKLISYSTDFNLEELIKGKIVEEKGVKSLHF